MTRFVVSPLVRSATAILLSSCSYFDYVHLSTRNIVKIMDRHRHPLKPHWTGQAIEKFIDLYKQHDCLWNPELESYKNGQKKQRALKEIVAQMRLAGLTFLAARDRIKSMRTMYRRELNKVIKSESSETDSRYVYKPKLFWFNQMDAFLRPIAVSRMDVATLACPSLSVSQNAETNEDSDNSCAQEHKDNVTPISADDEITEDIFLMQTEDHRLPSKSTASIEQPHKKRKCSVMRDLYALPETKSNLPDENEFDIFGKFISAQLKKLPLITALQCQQKIQDFLTSKRIEILEYNNVRSTERAGEISGGESPFSSFIDAAVEYEEKPNIHKDVIL